VSLITSRTNENAKVELNYEKCNTCGLCVKVCKDLTLQLIDKRVIVNNEPLFGCIGCGQCVAICPHDAMTIEGRTISVDDFTPLPAAENKSNYSQLLALLNSRRSVRDFKNIEVDQEIIEKILEAAKTAPMGIPPSDVEVLILNGKSKVHDFSNDMIAYFKQINRFINDHTLWLLKPFIKKSDYQMFKTFIIPMIHFFVRKKEEGEDWLLYEAPLAMYFYNSPYSDPADAYITSTYAMIAAESLGLGSCMIGSINPFLEHGGNKIKLKYGINKNGKQGIVVVFGYPKYKYQKAIKRSFGKIILN
jgi:nitroreductase/NAD-dependent dihydropyrimidine dehydrogenase PreA subunit